MEPTSLKEENPRHPDPNRIYPIKRERIDKLDLRSHWHGDDRDYQVDSFKKLAKISDRFKSLSAKEKRKVNETFKKKQRRARPSAETWT